MTKLMMMMMSREEMDCYHCCSYHFPMESPSEMVIPTRLVGLVVDVVVVVAVVEVVIVVLLLSLLLLECLHILC